jgi:2-phosphosulfolactate phosphatase
MGSEFSLLRDSTDLFDPWPTNAQIHVEWGATGAKLAAARGDIVVIVDVLSFSTSITLAVSRGATVFSFSHQEIDVLGGPEAISAQLNANLIDRDRRAINSRFSLSPASLTNTNDNDRIIFTSLNGANCTAAAKASPVVLIGALTNRYAVADAVAQLLRSTVSDRCTLIACGEHWSSISDAHGEAIRPGIEDLIGVGAIANRLIPNFTLSEEALSAASAFASTRDRLFESLSSSVSGRELIAKGFGTDIELAVELDSVGEVPVWKTSNPMREFVRFSQRDFQKMQSGT